jgi:hypothetical protein
MKHKQFVMGMVSLMLVFALIIIGCPTDNTDGDNDGETEITFEGTWRNPYGSHQTYTFSGNTVTRTADDGITWTVTFTFTDTTITFNPSSDSSWTQEYTLSATELKITEDGAHAYGTFIKQS